MGETAPLCNHHWRVGEHLSIFLKVKLHFQRLRWDYLIPDDTDYESQAYTQNPKLKAFNWIKRHGTTMKQVISAPILIFPNFYKGGSCLPSL